jgi:hypothetical protein
MMPRAGRLLAGVAWMACGAPAARRFRSACHRPRAAQEAILAGLLRRNAETRYGRRHGFGGLGSVCAYQDRVPIITYDDIEGEIGAILRGDAAVLTAEPVIAVERTSGSAGASKAIPYTASLLREFQAALGAWMSDLYLARPRLLLGGAYWSISPLAEPERTAGGLPIGFEEDTAYFDGLGRSFLTRLLVTPPGLARLPSIEACRYVTLRYLLGAEDLSFVSVWHPSFLSLLLETAAEHAARLIEDIERGTLSVPGAVAAPRLRGARLHPRPRRAARLRAILRAEGRLSPSLVWPDLRVISCWASAAASPSALELARLFPQAEIQPKGLLATEGVTSIPLVGHAGAALAVTSHFIELLDEERPDERPSLVDEVEPGRTYRVLLTTGGGLYRYATQDRVRVVGHVAATPLVEFVGKDAFVSDLCGEKLDARRVEVVIASACRAAGLAPAFTMLAPEEGRPPYYALFVEGDAPEARLLHLAASVEDGLLEGPPYRYCRRLAQLGPVRAFRIPGGAARAYLDRCTALGQRAGGVKPTLLHRTSGWSAHFEGGFVRATSPIAR